MEYVVIVKEDADDLEKEVNSRLKDGWQLVGGVAAVYCSGYEPFRLYQAMTKQYVHRAKE
jgi:hypothetical protein